MVDYLIVTSACGIAVHLALTKPCVLHIAFHFHLKSYLCTKTLIYLIRSMPLKHHHLITVDVIPTPAEDPAIAIQFNRNHFCITKCRHMSDNRRQCSRHLLLYQVILQFAGILPFIFHLSFLMLLISSVFSHIPTETAQPIVICLVDRSERMFVEIFFDLSYIIIWSRTV